MLGSGTLILGAALAVSGTKALINDIDCKSTPYRKTRDGKPVSVTKKGDDYINGEACMSNPSFVYSQLPVLYHKLLSMLHTIKFLILP